MDTDSPTIPLYVEGQICDTLSHQGIPGTLVTFCDARASISNPDVFEFWFRITSCSENWSVRIDARLDQISLPGYVTDAVEVLLRTGFRHISCTRKP